MNYFFLEKQTDINEQELVNENDLEVKGKKIEDIKVFSKAIKIFLKFKSDFLKFYNFYTHSFLILFLTA